jgi:hypothetical protein
MTREELDAFYRSQPSQFSGSPMQTVERTARPAMLQAQAQANPIDRMGQAITGSDWFRKLSPEAQKMLTGGGEMAEFLPPVAAARGGYDAGAGFAGSDYGQAATGLLNAIPELGHGGAALAGAVMPAARKAVGAAGDVERALPGGTRLVGPGGMTVEVPHANGAQASAAVGSGGSAASVLPDERVAQRVPFSKSAAPNIGSTQDLRINQDAMREDPAFWEKATNNPLRSIIPEKVAGSADPEERAGAAMEVMTSNLRRLYEGMDPAIRERAIQWYPGGNKIAEELAQKGGIDRSSAAGAIAALSPQKDWYQNVEMARRMIETYGENPQITDALINRFMSGSNAQNLRAHGESLKPFAGMRLSELPDKEAGLATYAHTDATRPNEYPILSPEGGQLGYQTNASTGDRTALAWQGLGALENAMSSIRSGGDRQTISNAVGGQHKVRNFYNNIISPNGPYDDYTSDTHNIAAALLRPLGGSDMEVKEGLGNAGPSSAKTGTMGLYGMYADAGRDLAKQYGIKPYQVQSPTWEGVRALFPAAQKQGAKKDVGAIWEAYRKGDLSLEAAQDQVFDYAKNRMGGNINRVPWRDIGS